MLNRKGPRREWCFFWYDPRPGWDKNRFSRHIFALDHNYKLFDDGRMFDIRGTVMRETKIDPSQLDTKAKTATKKLRQVIDQMMQGTLLSPRPQIGGCIRKPTIAKSNHILILKS